MIKRLLIAIVLLALLGGGIVGFNMFRDQAIEQFFANMPVQTLTVSATTAEESRWTPAIDAIGTANAARGVQLTVETTGIVREVDFSANQTVEQGQLLVQLDDAVQRADLEAGRSQLDLDRQALERAQELQRRGVGSNVSLEAAQAASSASQSQLARLEAVLEQKQLRAPFAGTIGIPRIAVGEYLQPGTVVATLQDLDTMRADFTVPEQELARIRIGQQVRIGTGNGADLPFTGEIVGIDPRVDPASRLVSVRAEIANPEGALTPGQFVQIKVDLPVEDGVVALPQTSVVTSLYGDYVYVVRPRQADDNAQSEGGAQSEGEAQPAGSAAAQEAPEDTQADAAAEGDEEQLEVRQVFVQVGRRSGSLVEIVEGVAAGDRVVTAGQNRLNNGTPVRIDNSVDPAVSARNEAASR